MSNPIPKIVEPTDIDIESSSASVPPETNTNLEETSSSSNNSNNDNENDKHSRWTKTLIAVLFLAIILFVILDSTVGESWIRSLVTNFLEWIQDHPIAGLFAFVLVYFLATVLFIPGSILTLGAGFVFANAFGLGAGVLLGTLSVFLGASAGSIVAFLLGRYLLRDWVSRRLTQRYSVLGALDSALAEKGFRIMVLLRLSPIIPFNALNYIASITAVGFWQYTWALVAILPGTILYVFLGASAGSLTDSANGGDDVTIIVVVVGIVFGVLAVALTSYYARQELNKITSEAASASAQPQQDEEVDVEAEVDADEALDHDEESGQQEPY